MEIITGYKGSPHVTAAQDRQFNRGIYGDAGCFILPVGSRLAASIATANSVSIADGILVMQGCTASIADGSSQTVTLTSGTQGRKRIDIICARYTVDAGTSVENVDLYVLQGEAATGTPAAPTVPSGSIANGQTAYFPLYSVLMDGVAIDSITQLAPVAAPAGAVSDGTADLTAGTSPLADGEIYLVYE